MIRSCNRRISEVLVHANVLILNGRSEEGGRGAGFKVRALDELVHRFNLFFAPRLGWGYHPLYMVLNTLQ